MGEGKFSNSGHLLALREEIRDRQKNWDGANDAKIKGLVRDLDTTNRSLILRSKIIGTWINIRGTTETGTVLAATEFCGLLCARYNVTPPPNLQSKLYGCVTSCGVHTALIYSKGYLVIAHHNELCDKLL